MEAGKLIALIFEAVERGKSVIPLYLYEPYTATTAQKMADTVRLELEKVNTVLREELGIELYTDIIPVGTDTTFSAVLKVRKVLEVCYEK